ncbi:MAG: ribonuclease HI family protein [Candidatus Jacksonbacteria bacterium]
MMLKIYTDGAAQGNPGPAGAGAVIQAGGQVYHYKKYLGETTNNRAEYQALILALEKTGKLISQNRLEIDKIICYSDSELLVRQLRREYKVKDKILGSLFVKICNMSQDLPPIEYRHILREKNKQADKLANAAIDEGLE